MMLLSGVLWPLLIGFLMARALSRKLGTLAQVCMAPPLGMGAISCCFFLELETGIPALAFESVALVAAGAACWRAGRRRVEPDAEGPWARWAVVALAVVLAGAVYGFCVAASDNPHGGWDAWAIWNLHARFLVTPYWRDLFSDTIAWTHPDYPLLLPGFIARVWNVAGERDLVTPRAAAFLFTFCTAGLLGASVGALRGRTQGSLAALFLAASPAFIAQGATQCADIPLSFYILAAVALPAIEDRPVLAGLCAAMAAWTKNEGLLLLALAVPIQTLAVWRWRGARAAGAWLAWLTAGMAPVLAMVLFFRLTLATQNANLGGRPAAALASLLLDPHRWSVMLWRLTKGVATLGGLSAIIPLVLAGYLVCMGAGGKRDRIALTAGLATLAGMVAGYCVVCVVSPYDIGWQADTALPRLLLQVWPATLFLAFLAAKPPVPRPLK